MKSKFGKEDDVMLDREIRRLQRQIDGLIESHAKLYDAFSKLQDRFHDHALYHVETEENRS